MYRHGLECCVPVHPHRGLNFPAYCISAPRYFLIRQMELPSSSTSSCRVAIFRVSAVRRFVLFPLFGLFSDQSGSFLASLGGRQVRSEVAHFLNSARSSFSHSLLMESD